MIKKLRTRPLFSDEIEAFIKEAEDMIGKYHWEERIVHPYPNCPLKVTKIISDLKDYDNCTSGSKDYLVLLANGLADIMNKWEEHELAPKIKVRSLKSGKIHEVEEWMAKLLIEEGTAIAI